MFQRKTWAGIAVLTGALVVAAGGTAYAASGGWTTVSVPSTGSNVLLLGAAADANTDAWAVGQQFVAAGQPPAPPVAYHWDGSAWSLVPTPSLGEYGAFDAVSASSAADAWAVGFTMIRRLDFGTLIEHWNGQQWSATSVDAITGSAAGLRGVADLGPSDAWAVGEGATGGLAEHWNGTTWSVVPLPDSAFTSATGNPISAVSATDIWIVGSTVSTTGTAPEALHYNGTTWTVVPMAQPANMTGTISAVTAISAHNAWAVGQAQGAGAPAGGETLIEHWNGTKWSVKASPTPGADPSLSGVAARSAHDVYAVGTNIPSINGGAQQAMILHWNGRTWSVGSSGTFTGSLSAAATFPGVARKWAVGSTNNQGLILSHS
jgi:hypothetical protein